MSNFFNDPEAQRRYEERFGSQRPADDAPLFDDPSAQAAYEREGFRETPSLRRVDPQLTWHETIRQARAQPVETTDSGVVFQEMSASYSRLSERLKNRGPASTQGDSTSGGSF